jgi:hypothetical protein
MSSPVTAQKKTAPIAAPKTCFRLIVLLVAVIVTAIGIGAGIGSTLYPFPTTSSAISASPTSTASFTPTPSSLVTPVSGWVSRTSAADNEWWSVA